MPALLAVTGVFEKGVKADSFFESLGEDISNALFPDAVLIGAKTADLRDEIFKLQGEISEDMRRKAEGGFFTTMFFSEEAIEKDKARLLEAQAELLRFEALQRDNAIISGSQNPEENSKVTQAKAVNEALKEIEFDFQASMFEMVTVNDQQVIDAFQSHEDQKIAIAKQAADARLALTGGAFGALSTLMATGGKKAFKMSQLLAIAETSVSTYAAAQKAYESQLSIPTPDAPARAAVAAGIAITQGVARVAAIKKQKFGGGGATGGGGGGGGGSIPPQPDASTIGTTGGRQAANITISGDNFSGDGVRGLIDSINDALDDGAKLNVVGG